MGINNSLLKSIQTLVDKAINIAPFDKTRQAQIITNNGDGTYTIRLDGILYNNIPSYPIFNGLIVGTIVKVVIPSNQTSQMYVQPSKSDGEHKELIGKIDMYAGSNAPNGWLLCHGQAVSRTEYSDLFAVIGTVYGAGDGSTTFNVPDLRDRVPIGAGNTYSLNSSGGSTTHTHATVNHTLTVNQMPSHNHSQYANVGNAATGQTNLDDIAGCNNINAQNVLVGSRTTSDTGGGLAHNHGDTESSSNMMPYRGVNFIIYYGTTV